MKSRFRVKEVTSLIIVCCLMMAFSCAGPQTVKPFELGKVAAESLLYDARILQNKGTITADQVNQVRKVYDQLKVAQDIAIDARKAVIMQNDPANQAKAATAMSSVITISTQLIGLAQSMGISIPGVN